MPKKTVKRNTAEPLRIAAYVRVSTQRQATEGDSIEAQKNEITKYVNYKKNPQNWNVESLEFYADAGYSAKDQNRPGLQRLKQDIANGQIDMVVCFKLDRITRSIVDFLELCSLFDKHEVGLISLREDFDTSGPMGKALLRLILVFAELEREMTADRTITVMLDRLERGLWNGGHLYGYRSDEDENGKLIPDQEWAPIIKTHFFDAALRLGSAGAVQRELRRLGILTPVRLSRSEKQRGGRPFSKQQVLMILRNPLYIGKLKYGGEVRDGSHEPIISLETFERVQRLLDQTTKRRTNQRYSRDYVYLLRGLIRCPCGAMMTPKGAVGRSRTHHYYECTRQIHLGGKEVCSAPRVQAEALDQAVLVRLAELARHDEARDRIVQEALKSLDDGAEEVASEIAAVRHRLTAIQTETQNLISVLGKLGDKAIDMVSKKIDNLGTEEESLREKLRTLEAQAAPRMKVAEAARHFINGWDGLDELLDRATPEERRAILQHYVEVLELRSVDAAKNVGTYALRLFPEVIPARNMLGDQDLREDEGCCDPAPLALTEGAGVRKVDEKAPRGGLEPPTNRLTAGCSTIELSGIGSRL
jgi:site-specific DNA recombinase